MKNIDFRTDLSKTRIVLALSIIALFNGCSSNELKFESHVQLEFRNYNLMSCPQYLGDNNYIYFDTSTTKLMLSNSLNGETQVLIDAKTNLKSLGHYKNFIFTTTDSSYIRIDLITKEIKEFQESHTCKYLNEEYYTLDFAENAPIVAIDSVTILTRIYPLRINPSELNFYKKPILAILNLSTKQYKVLTFSYPSIFFTNRYGSMNRIFYGFSKSGIYACDQVSGEIQFSKFGSDGIEIFNLKDERINTAPLDSIANSDFNILFDHIDKTSYIADFFYNQFNNHFYRVLKLDKISFNNSNDTVSKQPAVLQELDENFKITSEIILDKNQNFYRIINSEKGILINNPKKGMERDNYNFQYIISYD